MEEQKKDLEEQIQNLEQEEKTLRTRYEALKESIEKEKDTNRDAEKAVFRIMSEENELISKLNAIHSKLDVLKKDEAELVREVEEVNGFVGSAVLHFKTLDIGDEKLAFMEDRSLQEERKRAISKLKIRLEDTGISSTDEVVKEYNDAFERDEFLARELLDLEKSAESLKDLIKDLEVRLAVEFSSGITLINKEFSNLFSTMFGGGEAELQLTKEKPSMFDAAVDEESEDGNKFEEGLDITVSLPRKKIRGLMMLSGGERALTSIALLFAISQVNPPPFIILDETDAALDEANSKRYGDMVEKLSAHSQLILITHNRETMSRAGIIYGVTMTSTGVSKLLSIAFDQAVEVAK
ncbi:hypothetical protein BH11PAT3_BH11PAT3_0370 [soil metagenome]